MGPTGCQPVRPSGGVNRPEVGEGAAFIEPAYVFVIAVRRPAGGVQLTDGRTTAANSWFWRVSGLGGAGGRV